MSEPGLWKKATAADGKDYYYNTVTHATTWDKPEGFQDPEGPTPAHAWRTHVAPDGKEYYEDTIKGTTTWDKPEVLKGAGGPPTGPRGQAAGPAGGAMAHVRNESIARTDSSDMRHPERTMTDRPSGYTTAGMQVAKEEQYATLQEAEAVFFKLLKRVGVEADWTWEQTIKAAGRDPAYRAITDAKDRKEAFEKYIAQAREEEKGREKERQAKLREDFTRMLKSHPEITYYTRWATARAMINDEMVFKAAKHEDERIQLFNDFRARQYREHIDKESASRKAALEKLADLLTMLNISPFARWGEAQGIITSNEQYQEDEAIHSLPMLDIIKAFEVYQKGAEEALREKRNKERFMKARQERQNRDAFKNLLRELRDAGKIRANSRWSEIQPLIEDDARYDAMLGQGGSTPMELFWDAVEEEAGEMRGKQNEALNTLEKQRFEVTISTSFEEFSSIMQAEPPTAIYDEITVRLLYDWCIGKVQERLKRERKKAEHHNRDLIDDLRSRMKRVDPPVQVSETWEQVRPRLEEYKEYRALDTDDLRRAAFDKFIRRLKEKEEDERHRSRDDRNGHSRKRRTATPEVDAYEADRRKAQADRERTYGKRGIPGVSPPRREWDRDTDRYDGRDSRKVSGNHYDRDRRDRESERERSYYSRADPKEKSTVLDYDDERPSNGTRRRRDSDEASVRSIKVSKSSFYSLSKRRRIDHYASIDHYDGGGIAGHEWEEGMYDDDYGRLSPVQQRLKRHERDTASPRESRRSRTPAAAPKDPNEGFHSGSEEGELEED